MHDFRPSTAAIITSLFVLAVAAAVLWDVQPPGPLPATAPDSLFSAARAAGYIREIAREPHPLGSRANAKVRSYIVRQLSAMGLLPRLDTAVVTGSYKGLHYAASVINIITTLPGRVNSKAVLLMADLDTVPSGPGASDDGSGVATILETLRALKASRPIRNDVTAIFTDGEEEGMMGGQALAQNSGLMKKIGVALNFEARGTSGPSIMFETSSGNGWLIKQLAEAVHNPVATSLSSDVYKHLPNNTDFSWLKAQGAAGMNFAFIGDLEHYHSELDNYSNLDESSIQQDGAYALSLTKRLGNMSLPGPESVDYIYFNFIWPSLVYYRSSLAIPITILAAFLYLLTVYIGFKKRTIKPVKTVAGSLLTLIVLLLLGAVTFFLWKALRNSYPESRYFLFGAFYHDGIFLCAFIMTAVALASAIYVFMRKYLRSSEMAVGSLFWWLVLGVLSTEYLQYGSYIFQWPVIFSSLAFIIYFLSAKSDFRSPVMMLIFLACSIPGIYLTSQTSYLVYLTGLLPALAAAIVVLVILGLSTILPHLAIMSAWQKWLIPIMTLAAALVFGTIAVLSHHIGLHHPTTDSIDYAANLDDSTYYWISFDDSTDVWTSQFMRELVPMDSVPNFFPGTAEPRMAAKASRASVSPVAVTLLSDTASHGAQFVNLLVKSPLHGSPVTIIADSGTQVLSAKVDGHFIQDSVAIFPTGKLSRWTLYYYGLPASGSTITLVIPVGEMVRLTTVETVPGLREAGGLPSRPRPGSIMPRPFVTTDASLVMKSYEF